MRKNVPSNRAAQRPGESSQSSAAARYVQPGGLSLFKAVAEYGRADRKKRAIFRPEMAGTTIAMHVDFRNETVAGAIVVAALVIWPFAPAHSQTTSFSKGCSAGISNSYIALTGKPPPFEYCCARHDRDYGRKGIMDHRAQADRRLAACIMNAGYPGMAMLMLVGVQFGGQSRFAFDWGQIDRDYSMKNWYAR